MADDTTDLTALEVDLDDRADHLVRVVVRVVVPPPDFDGWYATTAPRLLASLTLVTGDPHAAADATAEAMARALERWRRVRTLDAPEAWTYRVAVNVWKRQQRRTTLGRSLLRRTVPRSEQTSSAALPVELREIVDSLPHRQREVLVLRLVLGLSQAETAALTGIAEGTVASTLSDAKRSLRTALQDDPFQNDPEVTS
ncbi:MAG: sigma-70 family RNA polymerase sigma factor [Actinobacteria bacterium]|nr:sigma-70 family RNA polymerase sigma factor [Actinomycetota bacterium]